MVLKPSIGFKVKAGDSFPRDAGLPAD